MIFHIANRSVWQAALEVGAYQPESFASEGFIHASRADQVLRVANTWYARQPGLVLLQIDSSRLIPKLRWEAGTDKPDELFPHIYGSLNLDAVVHVWDFEPDREGLFHLPPSLNLP